MTEAPNKRELWQTLSWPWRLLVFASVFLLVCGTIVWQRHMNDELYYWGLGIIGIAGIALRIAYVANRSKG